MNDNKVYVEVIVKFSTEGAMMPIEFIWEDGTKYLIDKVKSKERCASRKAGGTGIMYTVMVDGKECHLRRIIECEIINGNYQVRKKIGSAKELTFPFCSFQIDI